LKKRISVTKMENTFKIGITESEKKTLWQNISNESEKGLSKARDIQSRLNEKADIEVEIQFGTYTPSKTKDDLGRFGSYVTKSEFHRVMSFMKKNYGNSYTEKVIEDKVDGDERVSYDFQTKKTSFYNKNKVWNSYPSYFDKQKNKFVFAGTNSGLLLTQEYGLRVNISNEFYYSSASRKFQPKVIRNKNRTSFEIDGIGYLDMTEATEIYPDEKENEKKSTQTKYEIELELYDSTILLKYTYDVQKFCELIRKVIQDSQILYTNSEKAQMYQYVSTLLHLKDGILKFSMLPEARDLKLEDMVYGGLVGNKDTTYCVTFKADGVRRLVVFMPTHIWAIMPGTPDANLLYRYKPRINPMMTPPYPSGFIVDGELLTKETRKDTEKSELMFYIFDCLVAYNQDIRNMEYYDRMEKALDITEFNFNEPAIDDTIKFVLKSYKILNGVNHFFETMKLVFYEEDDLAYVNDGVMFIPVNVPYNIYDDSNMNFPPIFERTLTQYPDICKWKPQEKRSIDFLVEKTPERIILKTGGKSEKDRTPILFEGSDSYPLKDRIDSTHPLLNNLPDQSIVEFSWDEQKQLLIPLRIRTDKLSPNRYFTALNVWKNIFQGIDKQTLTGETFQLMRSYHNRIKLDLYKNIKYTSKSGHKVLLDIGSGRGGDIRKWNSFDLIFAVEPNPEHIEELKSRLAALELSHKVVIIQTGGENYEKITRVIQERLGERVSTVSLMLSMSFFSGKAREGLRKTIEQNLEMGGDVLVFTINGDTVQQMFVPSSGEYKETTLRFLNAETTYQPSSGKLFIDIPSTIVKEQEEIPPKLSELFKEWDNFLPLNVSRADKEKFLNPDEKSFSNMFTSFRYILMSNLLEKIEIERIIPIKNVSKSSKENGKETGKENGKENGKESSKEMDLYGISVFPSDYFYLSAILKAIDEEYQNNNSMDFRREYVLNVWRKIEKTLDRKEKEKYQLPWNDSVLELFSNLFGIQILCIDTARIRVFGQENKNKIIILDSYILSKSNELGQLQTIFE
jgi:hypothetical protein